MSLFLVSALRAVVEMLGLCLLGRAILALVSGTARERNPIYMVFKLVSDPPCKLVARCLPGKPATGLVGGVTFILLVLLWVGLAIFRKYI